MMDGPIPPSSTTTTSTTTTTTTNNSNPHPPSSSSPASSTVPTTASSASNISPSSASSSSAVFRPRRSDDWQQYRPIIEQLYLNSQLKLRDVKIIMEREHRFVASEKQYKDRLAAWHIRKNIKAKEVHVMIRKQQKRAARGKQTAFRVGGQEVDSKRISRFLRRYGSSWENSPKSPPPATPPALASQSQGGKGGTRSSNGSPEPETPTDMSCYTPEPEDRPTALSPMSEIPSDPREMILPGLVASIEEPVTECVLGAFDQQQQQHRSHLDPIQAPPLFSAHSHTPVPHNHTHRYPYTHPHPHPLSHPLSLYHSHSHHSTLPHTHPHPHPHLPDETSQSSLSATMSPSLTTNDTPKPITLDDELQTGEEDGWSALISFQNRLNSLNHTLEQSMSAYSAPLDD